jgi:hypothetical protein
MTFSITQTDSNDQASRNHTYKPTFTSFSQPIWVQSGDDRSIAIGFRMKQGNIVYVTQFNEEIPASEVTDLLALKAAA